MIIPLNLNKEKREIFLEYFHASYRKLAGSPLSPSGQAGYRNDGCYEILLTFALPTSSGIANLVWSMDIEVDGSLERVEVRSDELPEDVWSEAATKFVSEVLSAAFAETLTSFFHRTYVCRIGADLHGEYWLPGFRFAPSMPEDQESFLMDAERYFYIDQEVDAIDNVHANDIANERALNITARLSLILDVALYKPSAGKRWFLVNDESGNLISKREYLGFVPLNSPTKMPKKGVECRAGEFGGSVLDKYQRSALGLLKCPNETRKILRGVAKCVPNIQEAFDSCARLYQTSLVAGRGFPTIRLAYQVGAIESITQRAGGYEGFSDFVIKEAELTDVNKEFLDYLYRSIRSAHLHGGAFPLGEYSPRKWSLGLSDPADLNNQHVVMNASWIMRRSIMGWILREIVSKAGESS